MFAYSEQAIEATSMLSGMQGPKSVCMGMYVSVYLGQSSDACWSAAMAWMLMLLLTRPRLLLLFITQSSKKQLRHPRLTLFIHLARCCLLVRTHYIVKRVETSIVSTKQR